MILGSCLLKYVFKIGTVNLWKSERAVSIVYCPTPCISGSCIEIKINLIFILTLLCGVSKGFMKAL